MELARGKWRVLSIGLALVLVVQLLGIAPMKAFGDEVRSAASSLVYDKVYGVVGGEYAFMIKETVYQDQYNFDQTMTQQSVVNKNGEVLSNTTSTSNPFAKEDPNDVGRWTDTGLKGFTGESTNPAVRVVDHATGLSGLQSVDGSSLIESKYSSIESHQKGSLYLAFIVDKGTVSLDLYTADGTLIGHFALGEGTYASTSYLNDGAFISIGLWQGEKSTKTAVLEKTSTGYVQRDDLRSVYDAWDWSHTSSNGLFLETTEGKLSFSANGGAQVVLCEKDFEGRPELITPGLVRLSSYPESRYCTLDGVKVDSLTGWIAPYSQGIGNAFLFYNDRLNESKFVDQKGKDIKTLPEKCTSVGGEWALATTRDHEGAKTSFYDVNGQLVKQYDGYKRVSATDDPGVYELIDNSSSLGAVIAYIDSNFEEVSSYVPVPGDLLGTFGDKEIYVTERTEDDQWGTIVDRNSNAIVVGDYTLTRASTGNIYDYWPSTVQRGTSDMYFATDPEGKFGAVNAAGAVVMPFVYDTYVDLGATDTNYFLVKKGNEWFFRSAIPDLSEVSATAAEVIYDGSTVAPKIDATYAGTPLEVGTDFDVTYTVDIAAGSGSAQLVGKGLFTGTLSVPFKVVIPEKYSYSDVPTTEWFYASATFAVANDLVKGYSDTGLFGPFDTLTRAQAATVLWRYFAPNEAASYDASKAENLTGLPDVAAQQWYTGAANWAVREGVINGVAQNDESRLFDPEGAITRQQLCAIVGNAAVKFCGAEVEGSNDEKLVSMPDASDVESWALNSVAWGLNMGVISGVNEPDARYVRPLNAVDRATMSAVMMNSIQKAVITKAA